MHANRISPSVIEILPQGTITPQEVAMMARDAHGLGRARDWLLDGTDASFDRDALATIGKALDWAKRMDGLRRLVLVIPQAPARLVARGMTRHSPVPIEIVASRDDANRVLGI